MLNTERHVFISYRRADPDYTFAHQLADDLRAAGHPVWIDVEGIDGADEWASEIQWAIDQCYAYLIILSPDSVGSTWVRKEMIYALGVKQGRVYPLLFRDVNVPFELIDLQYTDFLKQDYEPAWQSLLAALPPAGSVLPTELLHTLESERAIVRRGAVASLVDFAGSGSPGQQVQAEKWLDHLQDADPDERVRAAADRYFKLPPPPPEPPAPDPVPVPVAPVTAPVEVEVPPVEPVATPPASGFTVRPWMWAVGALVLVAAIVGVALLLTNPGQSSAAAIGGAVNPAMDSTEVGEEIVPTDMPPVTPTVSPTEAPATESAAAAANPTADLQPTPTPFGGAGLIAFMAQSPERQDIDDLYVINSSGGTPIRLTSGDYTLRGFQWSPDGTRLAYQEAVESTEKTDLYVVQADGTGRQLIAREVYGFCWSPDGQQIVYGTGEGIDLTIASADGSDPRGLAAVPNRGPGISIGWSPDGSYLIYDSNHEGIGGEIYTLELESGAVTRLTDNDVSDSGAGWLPDGRIIFSSKRLGGDDLFLMDKDGANVVPVADNAWLTAILPDGGLLVSSWRDGNMELYSVSLAGDWLRLTNDQNPSRDASVSPDGTKIAYWSGTDLTVMDADGGNPLVLASFADVWGRAAWQPSR